MTGPNLHWGRRRGKVEGVGVMGGGGEEGGEGGGGAHTRALTHAVWKLFTF